VGWLRDLMGAREPKIQSYGELARKCLESPTWPPDIQPQPRSLASLFSKFDRGIEVEWLHDRPEVQVVLARVLDISSTVLETELRKHVANADEHSSRWRLREVPRARPIDLREEPLPRVYPPALLRPGLWTHLWWTHDAPGAAELLGRWLAARSFAEFATCSSWTDVLEVLGSSETAPLFVVYFGHASDVDRRVLGARPVCFSSAAPAPAGFDPCESLPFEDVCEDLIDWLTGLLPPSEQLEKNRVVEWLARWKAEGIPLDLDTASGLVGAAHQLGLAATERLSARGLAQQYLKLRLDQLDGDIAREAKWLRVNGLELPVGLAKNALRKSPDATWHQPRTKNEWLELIPEEYQQGIDADWTKLSLQLAGAPLTVAELEKALSQVPPGGFRVLNVLCEAQLLQETSNGKWSLHPRWLVNILNRAAYAALLDDVPEEWGKVGLRETHAVALLDALERQFAEGDLRVLEAAVDLDDTPSPAFVVAIELLVVAAGRYSLNGGELDPELVSALLRLQSDFTLDAFTEFTPPFDPQRASLPRPRMLPPLRNLHAEWLLAVWALTEQTELSVTEFAGDLNPWADEPRLSHAALEAIERSVAALPAGHPRVAATYSLLGRVLQHLEKASPNASAPYGDLIDAPVFSVAKVLRGDGWPAWQQVLGVPHGVESVKALVAPEAWQYLAKTAWRNWSEKGADPIGLELFSSDDQRRNLFWPHLPDRVLQGLLDAQHPIVLQVPAECMKSEWVTMYLERVPEDRERAVQFLEVIPAEAITEEHFEVLFELLEFHCLTEKAAPVFSAHPDAALTRTKALLDQGRAAGASLWLACVPDSQRPEVVAHIRKQVEDLGRKYPSFSLCRAWLVQLCDARVPGWLDVYLVLEELESRLKRLQRAFEPESAARPQ
jgi:hypothetical protein